jgi:adenylyl- and sulfurtransferase ThiI
MDKLDIERISKKEGIWHEVHSGCCYATPRYPRTRASPEQVDALLKNIKLDDLIKAQIDEIFEVRTFKEDFKSYLESLV